jgi:radical SAM enzyme (TIGR01210 family)
MYPDTKAARDRWVLAQRPAALLASRVTAAGHGPSWFSEAETDAAGRSRDCLTVLLRNPECPWRCVFCDLWQHTAPRGQASEPIGDQIRRALAETEGQGRDWAKLYNAGSFFDAGAIPSAELPGIAELCRPFARVIVECHPTLVRPAVFAFRDQIRPAQLEVALGLETAHPETLAKLNKGITPDDFARAAGLLRNGDVDIRAFVLVRPPFLEPATGLDWVFRSLEFAFAAGASVVSLIPTRLGNGALEALAAAGQFVPPTLAELEAALEFGLRLGRGRVFADLWELDRWAASETNFTARRNRLAEMNRRQVVLPAPGT